MRRVLSIFLALLVWTTTSGVGMALHHAALGHDSQTAHHDESTCRICAAFHAAMPKAELNATDVSLQLHQQKADSLNETREIVHLILTPPCRGPPAC